LQDRERRTVFEPLGQAVGQVMQVTQQNSAQLEKGHALHESVADFKVGGSAFAPNA
jgi:hypothetical protein